MTLQPLDTQEEMKPPDESLACFTGQEQNIGLPITLKDVPFVNKTRI
jgi:hypothetical protein